MDGKFDAFQIVFFRAVVGLFMVVPVVFRFGMGTLRTTKMPLHILRTLCGLLAMAALYYAVAVKPLAEVISLTFLIPIFVTIASSVVLREVVGLHRWMATAIGFTFETKILFFSIIHAEAKKVVPESMVVGWFQTRFIIK